MTGTRDLQSLSLWFDSLPEGDLEVQRPALDDVVEADVAIVGGGLTGLWSAYYLATADPSLRVVVLEAEVAGFGASGRNGGWCSGLLPVGLDDLAAKAGREGALALLRAAQETVDEVGRVCEHEGIDARFAKGGYLRFARTPLQVERLREALAEERSWEQTEDDIVWLDRDLARERVGADGVFGGLWSRHCAAVDPARMVRGLARVVERLGVTIHEHSRVTSLSRHEARTDAGVVHARHVVRATEGYTPLLPGRHRALLPMTSMVIATQPLPASFWDEVGWRSRDTFNDDRRFIIYAQRTADDRIVIGGRGAPYHYGSRVSAAYDRVDAVHDSIRLSLLEFFPQLADAEITHRWGGTLGISRDWWPSVTEEPDTGVIAAGGYAGDGVALTNLAGRTVAALVTDRDSPLLALPWVGHRSRTWEPEPLRWFGITAGIRLAQSIDAAEQVSGRAARRRDALMRRLTGH